MPCAALELAEELAQADTMNGEALQSEVKRITILVNEATISLVDKERCVLVLEL
jgi:hypothetical protein